MKENHKGQVQLSKLIFTHNWEDPIADEKALRIKKGDKVFAITSGGCNALGFLRFEPSLVYCVDINPAQTYLMDLKKTVIRMLDQDQAWKFLGLTPYRKRLELYERLRSELPPDAKSFFDARLNLVSKGILMNGRYERFVKIAGRIIRMIQGQSTTNQLFELSSLEQQQEFYKTIWNNRRWRWIFKAMFNKKRLAKKGLNADYFHFDDGTSSFSESFQKRAEHALTELPVQSNYFLSLYFFGKYKDNEHLPDYLKPQHFPAIKKNIHRIEAVTADSKFWLEKQPGDFFDAMTLSNICELMDEKDTYKLFSEVIRTAKPGARIVFRNLMIPREVPESLQHIIVKDKALSKQLQFEDRSFVYGKVAAYTIDK
jgi:S-adenosylmethionine-diacylglycerol 3-amino-3-carboxypropyl transferase